MARKKNSIKFGFIFWIAFILIVLLLFFINKDNIKNVLANIDLKRQKQNENLQVQIQEEIERINKQSESETPDSEKPLADNSEEKSKSPNTGKEVAEKLQNENKNRADNEGKIKSKVKTETTENDQKTKSKKNESTKKPLTNKLSRKSAETKKAQDSAKNKPKETAKIAEAPTKTRRATIYFVTIDSDGHISRVAADRQLAVSDSPMSDALKSLFAGTTKAESEKSYRSLIPPETKLLSATVRDGIAYINVSEGFEFNRFGIEGYLAELAQVVYTATEFPTVQSVQFLIEGKTKNYLGSDGVWIGSPLSRNSF